MTESTTGDGGARGGWRGRRDVLRSVRRERALSRVVHAPQGPLPDPLAGPRSSAALRGARLAGLALAALIAHGAVLGGFFGVSAVLGGPRVEKKADEAIKLVVVQPEPPPPPVEAPEPEPAAPEPTKPKPKPKPKAPPPPDPVDQPKEPPPPPKKPVRRITGLSLGSTTQGGSGPSFAVGNTRMGRTKKTAEDPNAAKRIGNAPAKSNRRATRAPIGLGGPKLTKPKYAGPRREPRYPEAYRAQRLEARVTVEVRIGPDGKVTQARVVKGSPHPEFEVAALATARKQRWVPAKRGNEPIPYTLTYSYQFRVKD